MGRIQKPKGKDNGCKIISSNNDIPLQICSHNSFLKLPDDPVQQPTMDWKRGS